jgi:hypothetical protein
LPPSTNRRRCTCNYCNRLGPTPHDAAAARYSTVHDRRRHKSRRRPLTGSRKQPPSLYLNKKKNAVKIRRFAVGQQPSTKQNRQ